MAKVAKKLNGWKLATIGLIVVVVAGSVFALSTADETDDMKKLSPYDYSIAAMDESGNVINSDVAIVSKAFSVNEVKIEQKEGTYITYSAHFYDADMVYISSSAELTGEYTVMTPASATYMRVQITPTADDDGIVTWNEKAEYANSLTIKYNPELLNVDVEEE